MKKCLIVMTFILFSSTAFSLCEFQLNRHERCKRDAQRCAQAATIAAAIGSFFTPIVSFAGGAFFAGGAALFDKDSRDAWDRYQECTRNAPRIAELQREENRKKEQAELEEKRKKDEEKDKEEADKTKEEWDEDVKTLYARHHAERHELQQMEIRFAHKGDNRNDILDQLDIIEELERRMEELKKNPVKAVVQATVDTAEAVVLAPLRWVGIKKPW